MKFSIVCLTYKRSKLLEECLHSVLQQSFADWEMLIINDCADQTLHFDHPQVRIFNLKERFPSIASKRNFGVDNSMGDLVLQLDDDDFLLPDYLENIVDAIGNADWLMAQRPIMYHDDPKKICLSPVPQCNAFVYRRRVIWPQVRYESIPEDEGITLNPFYARTQRLTVGVKRLMQLKPEKCGHVWRQTDDSDRKYSLARMLENKVPQEDQAAMINSAVDQVGDITLVPQWRKDYTSIIRNNLRIIDPIYAYSQIKGGKELVEIVRDTVAKYKEGGPRALMNAADQAKKRPENAWQVVKPTWANAFKFAQAVKSRGLMATALDVMGVNNSAGDRVPDDVYEQRKLSCFGKVDAGVPPCSRLKYVEARGYFCGDCGCGNNELARLDSDSPDEYTKLHYPKLQCPLKKKGFSNWGKSSMLTVIITALNEDAQTLNDTINSIRETSSNVDIIVVDDCSDIPVVVSDKSTTVIRNNARIGVAQSRHRGAQIAESEYLLFTDSHMIFNPKWYSSFLTYAKDAEENVVFCGVCIGLDDKHRDLEFHCGKYYGARLALWEQVEHQVMEGKWIPEQEGDAYEISCMMGACYFINREYFFKLRGLSDLKMWGSDEPCLSLKILLSGGKILLIKGVEIGHIFRDKAPYVTGTRFLVYNKMRMAKTLLPNELAEKIIDKLPRNGDLYDAAAMLREEAPMIEEYKKYYQSIFTVDINTICEKFNIELP